MKRWSASGHTRRDSHFGPWQPNSCVFPSLDLADAPRGYFLASGSKELENGVRSRTGAPTAFPLAVHSARCVPQARSCRKLLTEQTTTRATLPTWRAEVIPAFPSRHAVKLCRWPLAVLSRLVVGLYLGMRLAQTEPLSGASLIFNL